MQVGGEFLDRNFIAIPFLITRIHSMLCTTVVWYRWLGYVLWTSDSDLTVKSSANTPKVAAPRCTFYSVLFSLYTIDCYRLAVEWPETVIRIVYTHKCVFESRDFRVKCCAVPPSGTFHDIVIIYYYCTFTLLLHYYGGATWARAPARFETTVLHYDITYYYYYYIALRVVVYAGQLLPPIQRWPVWKFNSCTVLCVQSIVDGRTFGRKREKKQIQISGETYIGTVAGVGERAYNL